MIRRRKRRTVLGIPMPGSKRRRGRRRPPVAKIAGATAALAAAVPAAQKAAQAMGRGRELADQASGVIETAHGFQEAVSSKSSTIGKAGAVISEAKKLGGDGGSGSKPKLSHLIEEHIDIAVPRSVAYNQWTQFRLFPSILKGVESVEQQEDEKAAFTSKIGPSHRTWTGRIVEQVPDERIAWKSEGGPQHQGVISFHELGDDLTRVLIQMEYHPQGAVETVGNTLRIQRRRVRRDLRLFKHFVELRGEETGGWRGQINADGESLQPQFAGQGGTQGDQGESGSGDGRKPRARTSGAGGNQSRQQTRASRPSPARAAASRKATRSTSSSTSRAGAARQRGSSTSSPARRSGNTRSGNTGRTGQSARKSGSTGGGRSTGRTTQRSSKSRPAGRKASTGRTGQARGSGQKRAIGRSSRQTAS